MLRTWGGVQANATPATRMNSGVGMARVYLFKRGTVYPFAPTGERRRDPTLELEVRAVLTGDLSFEPDLDRWFPLWGTPVR